MKTLGETIRELRVEKKLPLRSVAAFLNIDQAILSKIETGKRNAGREQVVNLASYFNVNENDLLVAWLSDKLLYEVADEAVGLKALQVAEERIEYAAFSKVDRKKLLAQLKKGLQEFPKIQKAWIYGSFSREDDGPKSDIDIAINAEPGLSYFDLIDIQFQLEKLLNRKIDIGFMDTFKPYILENLKDDLKLVYEKR